MLITGGGSGLGRATALSAIDAGATVTLVGRRREPLEAVCAEVGDQAGFVAGDITNEEGRQSLVRAAERERGPITVLVNNAGVHLKERLVSMAISDLRSVIETHVTAAVALTQLVVPAMTSAGVVRSLAVELAAAGIRVNGIAPGWIESPMLRQALAGDTERESRILARTPMHRFGAGEDIGRAVVYMASDAGKFVNGVLLPVDGGALIGF